MMMMTMMMIQNVTVMSEVRRHKSVMKRMVSVCVRTVSLDQDVTDVLLDSTASLAACVCLVLRLSVCLSVRLSVCLIVFLSRALVLLRCCYCRRS